MVALENQKVLVLNKNRHPVEIIPMYRAIRLLTKCIPGTDMPKARVVDQVEFADYNWMDWSQVFKTGDMTIRSASREHRVPEIIMLSKYDKMPQQRTQFSRRTVHRRDNNQCQYCGCRPGVNQLTIDHLLPKSKGGKSTWDNCVTCCGDCNRDKADLVPTVDVVLEDGKAVEYFTVHFNNSANRKQFKKRIKKPVRPKFSLHQGEFKCKSWEQVLGFVGC